MICYALVGIPLNTILLSSLADYFSNHVRAHNIRILLSMHT